MLGAAIIATDGEIGKAYDVFFDDQSWTVCYLVVETDSWLQRRRVLLSPADLGKPDWTKKTIPVLLSKERVQSSPSANAVPPCPGKRRSP
jgi:hypothetical protein